MGGFGLYLSLGRVPEIMCGVLLGRLLMLTRRSKCWSVVGFTSALTRVLRSDGVASVMNLGRGAK